MGQTASTLYSPVTDAPFSQPSVTYPLIVAVAAQVQRDDAVFDGELLHLVLPLLGLSPKPMDEYNRPLGMIG